MKRVRVLPRMTVIGRGVWGVAGSCKDNIKLWLVFDV